MLLMPKVCTSLANVIGTNAVPWLPINIFICITIPPHTDCRMAAGDEAAIHEKIRKEHGVDTRSLEFRTVSDQRAALITPNK